MKTSIIIMIINVLYFIGINVQTWTGGGTKTTCSGWRTSLDSDLCRTICLASPSSSKVSMG